MHTQLAPTIIQSMGFPVELFGTQDGGTVVNYWGARIVLNAAGETVGSTVDKSDDMYYVLVEALAKVGIPH